MGRKPKNNEPMPEEAPKPKKRLRREPLQLVKGMKDILPAEWKYWDFVMHTVQKVALTFGFDRIETPILESTPLFVRGVGEETDIVEKELYSFMDRGKNDVALRPEFTAGVARAYIEHGMHNLPQPVKLYSMGPLFRHDRPQAGRYRQFWQLNFEIIGEKNPVLDAQIIQLVLRVYRTIGLKDLTVQINSVGDENCRPQYVSALREYFSMHENKLCKDCKRRLTRNPLRILDCKEEKCARVASEAPQFLDHLCDECSVHFKSVLEYLDELSIPYELNSSLVRGLDYYTKTAFEILPPKGSASQGSLGGGGRYDNLIEQLGGQPKPAVGFAGGIERLIMAIQEQGIDIPQVRKADVFLAQLSEMAKKKSLKVFEELRDANIDVVEALGKNSLKSQLKVADKLGVRLCLIIGQKEAIDGTIIVRDMESGIQEIVDMQKIVKEVQRRLEKAPAAAGPRTTPAPRPEPEEEYVPTEDEMEEGGAGPMDGDV